ncbi:hypothetical protein Tco_0361198 [Tanacetum coccineum]
MPFFTIIKWLFSQFKGQIVVLKPLQHLFQNGVGTRQEFFNLLLDNVVDFWFTLLYFAQMVRTSLPLEFIDDTQGRSDNEEIFDINDLHGNEIVVDMPIGEKQEQSAKEREVDNSVEDSDAPITIEEITLAQTLIQIKAVKPKVVTTAATTTTTTRPKARGL